MSSIFVKTPHDSSFSFSRRYFHWKSKLEDENDEEEIINDLCAKKEELIKPWAPRKKSPSFSVSKLRRALTIFRGRKRPRPSSSSLGTNEMIGTLFGHRRGHIHFSLQENPKLNPKFLIELAMPTSALVREMASGLVRIALECDKKAVKKCGNKLGDEPIWRTYCNGKKSGYAMRRECGAREWKVLKAVEPISMGAGVLQNGNGEDGSECEVMYMRAKFERVVGSKDSEAFYMMNPDGNGGPELSFYLLRV